MRKLYPEIEPYARHRLPVLGGHVLYQEECGNRRGLPVVFLHGGPGSGCNENHRRYFNPKKYRIILFDQRGCHRSKPRGSTENNTTRDLLLDVERLRKLLGIEQWLVFGGSWGSTLALLYAEKYPERVLGLILRGVFLARRADLDWYAGAGANRILPDHWERFVGMVHRKEHKNIIAAYHRRIFSRHAKTSRKYARAWTEWGKQVVTWNLPARKNPLQKSKGKENIRAVLHQSRIEAHYAYHHYFIRDNQILENISRIPKVPITIIHGRRDLTCALEASWVLHRSLSPSEFVIVPDAGHLSGEPAMVDALIHATDSMAKQL
ncbi:MAG: prolyl aminopeptidase [Gammaproteobacteria bacterium]